MSKIAVKQELGDHYAYGDIKFVWGVSWPLYGPEQATAIVKAVTGWDVTLQELLEVGERRVNMMRAFNAREGIARDQKSAKTGSGHKITIQLLNSFRSR